MLNQIKVELLGAFGGDRGIAESAWTSTRNQKRLSQQRPDADVERVIIQLAAERHGVPFESVIFKWHIALPTFCDRQVVTHRIASHSGLSGRYRTLPSDWYTLPQEVIDILNDVPGGGLWGNNVRGQYDGINKQAHDLYNGVLQEAKKAIADGFMTNEQYKRVRECLRGVIPVCNMTERVTIMNLRSWANFIRQRSDAHAQPEIQTIANQMLEIAENSGICPIAIRELKKNGWNI